MWLKLKLFLDYNKYIVSQFNLKKIVFASQIVFLNLLIGLSRYLHVFATILVLDNTYFRPILFVALLVTQINIQLGNQVKTKHKWTVLYDENG